MKRLNLHIATAYIVVLTAVAAVAMAPYARAENDKRGASVKSTPKQTSLTPMNRLVNSALRTLAERKAVAELRSQPRTSSGRDSAVAAPRIISTRVASEVFTARVELAADEPLVEIAIFNMLGKRVMDVYKGSSSRGVHEHTQSVSDLPEGVYMCVMQGSNYRKAEKFFFSR